MSKMKIKKETSQEPVARQDNIATDELVRSVIKQATVFSKEQKDMMISALTEETLKANAKKRKTQFASKEGITIMTEAESSRTNNIVRQREGSNNNIHIIKQNNGKKKNR